MEAKQATYRPINKQVCQMETIWHMETMSTDQMEAKMLTCHIESKRPHGSRTGQLTIITGGEHG